MRNQAAPEVRVRKTAQKYSGAPAQVLHEKVERAERVEGHLPHLVHMRIYQHLYVLVCSHVINNTLNRVYLNVEGREYRSRVESKSRESRVKVESREKKSRVESKKSRVESKKSRVGSKKSRVESKRSRVENKKSRVGKYF